MYKGTKIIDTPGHADFGRWGRAWLLNMADGVLLLVDALKVLCRKTRFVPQTTDLGWNLVSLLAKVM
jgi:predicted membrane GTPase involved in stress response